MQYPKMDFAVRPLVVVWEMTQACDLVCLHCRAEAQPRRNPQELTLPEARRLLDQVRELDPGVLVLSGGDPMKRPDVYELVNYGAQIGVRMAMTPSVTPLLTDDAIHRLAREGLARIAFSLDGSSPELHDSFRGVAGSYDRTVHAIKAAREAGLPVQINTTVSRHNMKDLPRLAEFLSTCDIELWSVFFLVPVGRGQSDQRISPEEYEEVFELLWSLRQRVPFEVKSTEAPHYRRFVLQKLKASRTETSDPIRFRYASMNVNDGRGFVFISHTGDVCPSGFLPVSVGNVRDKHIIELYRETPLMQQMRDSDLLGGKCGECEFRKVCGGSRARSYALSGDPLAAEPDCSYQPAGHPAAAPNGGVFRGNVQARSGGAAPARKRFRLADRPEVSWWSASREGPGSIAGHFRGDAGGGSSDRAAGPGAIRLVAAAGDHSSAGRFHVQPIPQVQHFSLMHPEQGRLPARPARRHRTAAGRTFRASACATCRRFR